MNIEKFNDNTLPKGPSMIVVYAKNIVFKDIAKALYQTLRQAGCAVQLSTTFPVAKEKTLYILFGSHEYPIAIPKKVKYIVYQLEQTPTKQEISSVWNQKYLNILHNAQAVWDYSVINVKWLRNVWRVPNVSYVPLGYASSLEEEKRSSSEKDIDILFFGSESDRRKKYIQVLKESLGNRCTIVWKKNAVWDSERNDLISRSRIVLNIHFGDNGLLEIPRLLSTVSNKGFVISEWGRHRATNKKWADKVIFVPSSVHEVVRTCEHYLFDKNATSMRVQFVKNAYCKVKQVQFGISDSWLQKHQSCKRQRRRRKKLDWYYPNPIQETPTSKMDGGVRLLLDDIKDEDLPTVSIITPTRNRRHLFSLAIRNWRNTVYPKDKIEWVVFDDGEQDLKDLLEFDARIRYVKISGGTAGFPIGYKRNLCVEFAKNEVIVAMDDDDIYFPHHVLGRVKSLITNKVGCVGCSAMGAYDLTTNKSSFISNGPQYLTESTMAFTRSFWKERPFNIHTRSGEYETFLQFRQRDVRCIPFQFVSVAFFHGRNVSGLDRKISESAGSYHTIHDVVDEDTKMFLSQLQKVIAKSETEDSTLKNQKTKRHEKTNI